MKNSTKEVVATIGTGAVLADIENAAEVLDVIVVVANMKGTTIVLELPTMKKTIQDSITTTTTRTVTKKGMVKDSDTGTTLRREKKRPTTL